MRQIDLVRASSNFEDVVSDTATVVESRSDDRVERMGAPPSPAVGREAADAILEGRPTESLSPAAIESRDRMEAIILERLRPAWFITDDQIRFGGEFDQTQLVRDNEEFLENVARRVGRVDLIHHPTYEYVGTGWLIDEGIAVTNRHVARIFARADWKGEWQFARGVFDRPVEPRLDYRQQHGSSNGARRIADVLEVLYIADDRAPDIAFLRVETDDELEPLELSEEAILDERTPVAAIGYPAWDGGRNDPELMDEIFGGIYGVKRFSPGYAQVLDDELLSDYTSLGGSSGSAVVSLETGKVVGLHFAGVFRETNYAVPVDLVRAALRNTTSRLVPVPEAPPQDPVTRPEKLEGRGGYDPEFLGSGDLTVPYPDWGPWVDDRAPVEDADDFDLRYEHFSVIQSASRRLPLLTAVNIDGEKSFRLKRKGTWRLDGRIALDHQVGNELYKSNPIDRGHLVRRMDPGWGASREEAQRAEVDTFHYTNSAPQHKDLNQKDWLGLEDYVLESASTRGFRLCVFTGPVFRDDDRTLRLANEGAETIRIPLEYWKIAAMINDDTGELSATGYVLSQGRMIRDLTEAAFVLGEYKTYQIRIAKIEEATGLDFGHLRQHDPLETAEEGRFGAAAFAIDGPGDLRLG